MCTETSGKEMSMAKMAKDFSKRTKPVAKRHHMVSGTLAPLYIVFGLKLGCSRAAAPIGDEVL